MTTVSDLYSDLQALRAQEARCDKELDAARERFNALKPEVPEAICVKGADDRMTLDSSWFRPFSFQVAVAKGMRQTIPAEGWRAMLADPPRLFGSDAVNADALARIRVGLAAAEVYEAALAEARRASGYDTAEAADNAASEAVWAMQKAIAAAAPANMDDVRLKAEAVLGWLGDDEPDACLAALLKSLADLPTSAAA